MKNTLSAFFGAAAACLVLSCRQAPLDNPGSLLFVNVNLPAEVPTKVSESATAENAVNSLQIFVFKNQSSTNPALNPKETDKWCTFTTETSYSLTLNTYTGSKNVWALVNAPRQSFATEKELMEHYSRLEENSPSGLLMVGNANCVVGEYNAAASVGDITTVPITVNRLGARVSLHNVKIDFSDTSLEGCSFTVKEVYLLNAVNTVRLDGTPRSVSELGTSDYWYNLEAWNNSLPTAAKTLLGDRGELNIPIGTTTGTQGLDRYFYVYPNVSTAANDNTESTASARLTRLVIHGHIDGQAGRGTGDNLSHNEESYYSLDIPKSATGATIEGNHTYDIESVTITMPGGITDKPEDRPKVGKISATVTVGVWGAHTTLTYDL